MYTQCLITLAFVLWVTGEGEGRVIVKRANRLVTIILIRSKVWIWHVILLNKCKKKKKKTQEKF